MTSRIEDAGEPRLHFQDEAHLALWAAVLRLGVHDAAQELLEGREAVHKGHWWVFRSPRTGPGSFIWCCGLFGFDPDGVRKQVNANRRELAKRVNAK